ncbi:MAG TPA: PTS sugar transporter subunit IIC [Gemmatimonadaceae bacterium]|nr:PTS sugar transporter subunit IIC [Gemmatimonadaceae bacterium]
MNVIDILPVALLGAILGLDVVTFPQAMISRPIVAATVAGAFVGSALAGLTIGATLELLALGMLPFGASKYPEWGSASVVGGVLYASQLGDPSGALAASLLAALLTAVVSGWSMIKLRRLNASRAAKVRSFLDAGNADAITGLQLFGLTGDLIRGGLVTFAGMLVFKPLVPGIVTVWHSNTMYSRALVTALAAAIAVAAVWKIFHLIPHARILFLAGLAVGISLIIAR